MLARNEDYAFAQPSLTTKKMRRLELAAGAPRRQGVRDIWSTNTKMRTAERELALQAQRAYERTVADWQANKVGAGATPGRASQRPSSGKAARQTSKPQRSAL
jgi:transposase